MKSNYFRIMLIVSIVCGFQQNGLGSTVSQPMAGAVAPSVAAVKSVAPVASKPVVSKPVKLVFETVPKIHSVAYYVNKVVKGKGKSGIVNNLVSRSIMVQINQAYNILVKNIEKQKNAGAPFTVADLKKFQLPPIERHTQEYYTNSHALDELGWSPSGAQDIIHLEEWLASYTKLLNDDLTGRMNGTVSFASKRPVLLPAYQGNF